MRNRFFIPLFAFLLIYFVIGVDASEEKVLSGEILEYSKDDFEPTREANTLYFPHDFEIKGVFEDDINGIKEIEYLIDGEWEELDSDFNEGDKKVNFELALPNGYYEEIAFRAIDTRENVSNPVYLQNEEGKNIKIVVDDREPVLRVEATADDKSYFGAWTNKDVHFDVQAMGRHVAELFKVQYQILENEDDSLTDESWKSLEENNSFTENTNGYVFFKGITKTGVETSIDEIRYEAWRLRIQKNIKELPEINEVLPEREENNNWYNCKSGAPLVSFVAPKANGEKEATISLRVKWTLDDGEDKYIYRNQELEILPDTDYDLSEFDMDFPRDGKYELEYWLEDEAGNETVHELKNYNVDIHEPKLNDLWINDESVILRDSKNLYYEYFYNNTANGTIDADFGASGQSKLEAYYLKDGLDTDKDEKINLIKDSFYLNPNIRGTIKLYLEDGAGNSSEIETTGIVIDENAPTGDDYSFIKISEDTNENGFYNKDVNVYISVRDLPVDTFSSLKEVKLKIENEKGILYEETLLKKDKDLLTEKELYDGINLNLSKIIDAHSLEGNKIILTVSATDFAGNKNETSKEIKIDVTNPRIEFYHLDNNPVCENIYNQNQTVLIRVYDKNFEDANIYLTKDGVEENYKDLDWETFEDVHETRIELEEDGNYSIRATATDKAGNPSEEVNFDNVIIDKSKPQLFLSSEDQAYKDNYYNRMRSIEIAVEDKNFSEENIHINVNSKNFEKTPWIYSEGKYKCNIRFLEDGFYNYEIFCTDKAGNLSNVKKENFFIDRVAPEILVQGLINNSANNKSINPIIYVTDDNYKAEDTEIIITAANGKQIDIEPIIHKDKAYVYDLSKINELEDGIYYLYVDAKDEAGNSSIINYRFSINRHGSTYDLTKINNLLEKKYVTYKDLEDLSITEFNLDKVSDARLFLSCNGKIIESANNNIKFLSEEYGNDKTGYIYEYLISKDNFKKEGTYKLAIYSKDEAGNEVNSLIGDKDSEIDFIVDNTAPNVLITKEENSVRILATDNFEIKDATFELLDENENVVKSYKGDKVEFDLPALDGKYSIRYDVSDMSGNCKKEVKKLYSELPEVVNSDNRDWMFYVAILGAFIFMIIINWRKIKAFKGE